MTQTTNYQLPQWSASDRVKRSDFNAAMSKIDTQMKANANAINTKAASSTVTNLQTAVNGKADKSTVTALQTTVNGKADSSAVQTALAGKADASDLTALQTTVAEKADASDLTALQTTVAGKADASALDAKADASAVSALQTAVNGKADSSTVSALQTTVAGKADASTVSALAAALGTGGQNCRIKWGSYVGDGTYGAANPVTLEFEFRPVLVLIGSWVRLTSNNMTEFRPMLHGQTETSALDNANRMFLTWTEHGLSYYSADDARSQYNRQNTTYYYLAFGYDG